MASADDANNCIKHLHRTGKIILFESSVSLDFEKLLV